MGTGTTCQSQLRPTHVVDVDNRLGIRRPCQRGIARLSFENGQHGARGHRANIWPARLPNTNLVLNVSMTQQIGKRVLRPLAFLPRESATKSSWAVRARFCIPRNVGQPDVAG